MLAILVAGTLAGCLGTGPLVPPEVWEAAGVATQAVPWLDAGLGEQALVPDLPATVSDALATFMPGLPVLQVPAAHGPSPLLNALLAYTAARGLPAPDPSTTSMQIEGLGLAREQEDSLARLVLAYLSADRLQAETLSVLAPEEVRLIALDPSAVSEWLEADPDRTPADLDTHIAALVARLDARGTLAAGQMLAHAVEDARVELAGLSPAAPDPQAGPWAAAYAAIGQLGHAPPRAVDPSLSLDAALGLLSDAIGVPTPDAVPVLPPDVDHAIAQVVAAHAAGASSDEPAWHAEWVLDAVLTALPVFEQWSMTASATAGNGDQGCVTAPSGPPDPANPPTAPGLPGPPSIGGPLLAVPIPSTAGPDCPGNPWLLLVAGPGPDEHVEDALIRIDLGGDDQYLGEVAGPAYVDRGRQASPVTIGSINIDLGGDDRYETPDLDDTQGSAHSGFSLLLDVSGADSYSADTWSQGAAACCLADANTTGAIGMLLDLAGDDRYAGGQDSQGSAQLVANAGTPPSSRVDAGAPSSSSVDMGRRQNATAAGILIDATGSDDYTFTAQAVATVCLAKTPRTGEITADPMRAAAAVPYVALGAVWDLEGDDGYNSRSLAVNPTVPDAVFGSQGLGRCPDPVAGFQFGIGAFLDAAGNDRYLVHDLRTGAPYDASDDMNNQHRSRNAPATGLPFGVGIFADKQVGDGFTDDPDLDGAPSLLETLAGTDPADGQDRPSDLVADEDPATGGAWVRLQPPRRIPSCETLQQLCSVDVRLPGLAILGAGDSALTEHVDFLVDLGGDDLYTAPHLGGAVPFGFDGGSTWFTSLVLDVGGGDDTYALAHEALQASPEDLLLRETAASLGGAVTGIAFLGDDGGSNHFRSSVRTQATVNRIGEQPNQAVATAYGVTQGAGMNGGLGILATWDSDNRFEASAWASAVETGGGASNPQATAYGIAQGAGWNGAGMLLSLGLGKDEATVEVRATTSSNGGARQLAFAQGAARAGIGVLVDGGGQGSWAVDDRFAQGAAWTEADGAPVATWASGAPREGKATAPYSALGVLWSGAGDSTYQADRFAQGVGVGLTTDPEGAAGETIAEHVVDRSRTLVIGLPPVTPITQGIRGAPAMGLLLDGGGQDVYQLQPGGYAAQGAGVVGGVGALVDAGGDDVYQAQDARVVQGAAHLGQGILVDFAGHDRYVAGSDAQGFATDDQVILEHLLACVGQPADLSKFGRALLCTKDNPVTPNLPPTHSDQATWGTTQAHVVLLAQFPTLGLLVDRHGSDGYHAEAASQGAVEPHLQYGAEAGVCKGANVAAWHPPSPQVQVPVAPFLLACEHNYYPGSPPLPGQPPRPATTPDTAAPPGNAFLLGLFVDTSHTDLYEPLHTDGRVPLPAGAAVPSDGNDWMWRQSVSPRPGLDRSKVPEALGDGAPAAESADDDLNRTLPSTPLPSEARNVLGFGIDHAGLAAASALVFQEVLAALSPVRVDLAVLDASGAPLDPEESAQGDLTLVADVAIPADLALPPEQRLVFLYDHEFLGAGQRSEPAPEGMVRYTLRWPTAALGSDGLPTVPDGEHGLQASFFPTAATSVESPERTLFVNNPPVLTLQLPAGPKIEGILAMSPSLGHRTVFQVAMSPDLSVPAGQVVPAGSAPGGFLEVRLEGPEENVAVPRTYLPAGSHEISLDGLCGADKCEDGKYTVRVLAEDSLGASSEAGFPLWIDGTPPSSGIDMPERAGLDYLSGTSSLRVRYAFDDDHGGPAGSGTGVASLDLFRVLAGGMQPLEGSTLGESIVSDGVATGATLRFVTVARDRIGNAEALCPAGGPQESPCGLPRDVTVDFLPPVIASLETSHPYVAPGITPVVFRVAIDEVGTGLESVKVVFDNGDVFPFVDAGGGIHLFSTWSHANGGLEGLEEPYSYRVVAEDRAGNEAERTETIVLDAVAPRIRVQPTQYRDPQGTLRPAGSGGSIALLRLDVEDAAVVAVEASTDALGVGGPVRKCDRDATTVENLADWVCQVPLPAGLGDGDYVLPVRARDAAGNEAWADVPVVVSSGLAPIWNVTVAQKGHDFVVLRWNTTVPATSQVLYGRTVELGRHTPPKADYATEHEVRVGGLPSATPHFFQVVSETQGGQGNRSAIFGATTASALQVAFPTLQEGQVLSGRFPLPIQVVSLAGQDGARVVLSAERDDGSGVVRTLETRPGVLGTEAFAVETGRLGDGAFTFIAQADRGGDFSAARSARIVIDNGAPLVSPSTPLPEGVVAAGRPAIAVLVADALGPGAVEAMGASVLVEGRPVSVAVDRWEPASPQGTLRLHLPDGLAAGPANLTILVPDWAGNVGRLELPVRVVDGVPLLSVSYGPGDTAVRRGGAVAFRLQGAEGLGLAQARLEVPAWPAAVDLVQAGGSWGLNLTVPPDAPEGRSTVVLHGTDAWGKAVQQTVGEVVVDATPPTVTAAANAVAASRIRLNMSADEPVRVFVQDADGRQLAALPSASVHATTLEGLRPGHQAALHITARDGAGNEVQWITTVAMPDDHLAPSEVAALTVASGPGGVPRVSWSPATDDNGIAAYEVRRSPSPGAEALFLVTALAFDDADAPYGEPLAYSVTAVDVAGNRGPPVAATHQRPVPTGGLSVLVTPARGSSDVPFQVTVEYTHPSGEAPERVEAIVGDFRTPLTRDVTSTDCTKPCIYTGTLRLAPTDQWTARQVLVEAQWRGTVATASVDAPTVVATLSDLDETTKGMPAPAMGTLFLALAALALLARRRNA